MIHFTPRSCVRVASISQDKRAFNDVRNKDAIKLAFRLLCSLLQSVVTVVKRSRTPKATRLQLSIVNFSGNHSSVMSNVSRFPSQFHAKSDDGVSDEGRDRGNI